VRDAAQIIGRCALDDPLNNAARGARHGTQMKTSEWMSQRVQ